MNEADAAKNELPQQPLRNICPTVRQVVDEYGLNLDNEILFAIQEIASLMIVRSQATDKMSDEPSLHARRPQALPKRQSPTGIACAKCGSFNTVQAGTCLVCNDCGDTSGGCS